MKLSDYLSANSLTEAQFAAQIGATQSTVNRLKGGQIPGKELMASIYKATGGKVRADDFFGFGEVG